MEKLLVSGCLLGHPCRYDGKAKRNEAVCALREKWELISVCPETMGGLKAPREPGGTEDGRWLPEGYFQRWKGLDGVF